MSSKRKLLKILSTQYLSAMPVTYQLTWFTVIYVCSAPNEIRKLFAVHRILLKWSKNLVRYSSISGVQGILHYKFNILRKRKRFSVNCYRNYDEFQKFRTSGIGVIAWKHGMIRGATGSLYMEMYKHLKGFDLVCCITSRLQILLTAVSEVMNSCYTMSKFGWGVIYPLMTVTVTVIGEILRSFGIKSIFRAEIVRLYCKSVSVAWAMRSSALYALIFDYSVKLFVPNFGSWLTLIFTFTIVSI